VLKLIECVPNFSEGQNEDTIKKIADAITSVGGVALLHVDANKAANRTVMTFAGHPQHVLEAAFRAIKLASELIDMSKHKGKHPRMGAVDVCPFIPISDVTFEECNSFVLSLAERVGNLLKIPIILYEKSATRRHRKNLADIRQGEYEKWDAKISHPDWNPDFGPSIFNTKSGITAMGVRDFLIAYNINLDTLDLDIAKDIASRLRESGFSSDQNGIKVKVPGLLKSVKAIAWYIEDFQKVQISTNLTDFRHTGLLQVFNTVKFLSLAHNIKVTGSELVGLVPKDALISDANEIPNGAKSLSEDNKIDLMIKYLNLNDVKHFSKNDHILENVLTRHLLVSEDC
jgi:glutamate formiminotransferase/formiminotetrahydrofolate cyclodeaminase